MIRHLSLGDSLIGLLVEGGVAVFRGDDCTGLLLSNSAFEALASRPERSKSC